MPANKENKDIQSPAFAIKEEAINDKFNSLLAKIESQNPKIGGREPDEAPVEKNKFNRDAALKRLYEESVQFKNSLSHLRTKLKGLNQQFGNYE